MLWEVEILPKEADGEARRIQREYRLLAPAVAPDLDIALAARGFLLEGDFPREDAVRLLHDLLLDTLVEAGRVGELNAFQHVLHHNGVALNPLASVLLKPGVMDPVAQSVELAARDLGVALASVRTFRRYYVRQEPPAAARDLLFRKVLANDAIEQVVAGPLRMEHLTLGSEYAFALVTVPLRALDDAALSKLSKTGQLALNLAEMKTIQEHFRAQDRDPTDIELETIAQTWSEHCSHKTLKGQIEFRWESDEVGSQAQAPITNPKSKIYSNLLKETIFAATQQIRQRLGQDDWCVSVFEDNAGIVRFNDEFNVCFKVETHNHPSAIEPYGGANTGLGGVIRDVLGTGLGAKPICNTDVFCFAPPENPERTGDWLPPGVLHPNKVMHGVVSGLRDYGNRMGIPTVNGAVCFDERYLANPLVYCGTVGLIPVDCCQKASQPGDLIVALGGRTGRDGIHGATFSSIELTSESEKVSGGAVQIGNAIEEKKLADVLLQARDLRLYHAVTDCGAGGFSSAVGEMGAELGARVDLDKAPLKYAGLSYTEIWISEAQERMVLAVPPTQWEALEKLCASEGVEAVVLGTFESTGRLRLHYQGQKVADLDMHFLHEGRPKVVRQATWSPPPRAGDVNALALDDAPTRGLASPAQGVDFNQVLLQKLSAWNTCSKEWIIRQYDHEVQGGSVLKPLVGVHDDGPGDAAVIQPVLGDNKGLAIACGINPTYGERDPYQMAALAIDEAVRNLVAVGADPQRIALLDNFCWGNTDRPETLGSLVRAAEACRDVALAYGTPFISGKDSLNNEFHAQGRHIVIPPTLLISALGIVPDVRHCVTMDLKAPGNRLFLVGITKDEGVARVPQVDLALAPTIFAKVHAAIQGGLVRSCHDLSEGGLAVALAEMAFAGAVGADVTGLSNLGELPDQALLFSEPATRFLLEVTPGHVAALTSLFGQEAPLVEIGHTVKDQRLRIASRGGEWLIWSNLTALKEAWQKPLRW